LGQSLDYREGDGPILSPPIRSRRDVEQHLDPSRLHESLASVYGTVSRLRKLLPADVALIGYAGAPWTVATYMVEGRGGGASEHGIVRQWALSDPDGFQTLIDLLTDATIQYLDRQVEAGAKALQLFESWAGILPETFFRRWCIEPVTSIVKALRTRHPSVPVIAFPQRRLTSSFSQPTQTVLRRPLESAQYVSIKYTERLAEAGIEPSVGSVGDSYDCKYAAAARGV
jgi:uroporphyrinogen decarboxylase